MNPLSTTLNDPVKPLTERGEILLSGMHCAACAGRIEKALCSTPGVTEASVNFATHRPSVRYKAGKTDMESLRRVVTELGYDAILPDPGNPAAGSADPYAAETELREAEYRRQKARFNIALILTAPVAVLDCWTSSTHLDGPCSRPTVD